MIYIAYFRSHKLHSEDQTETIGVYTKFNWAKEALNKILSHTDDEGYIRQYKENCINSGKTIWTNKEGDIRIWENLQLAKEQYLDAKKKLDYWTNEMRKSI